MGSFKKVTGDLFLLTDSGLFDAIAHGCNCLCNMGAGIAVPMKQRYGVDKFPMESFQFKGDFKKLGNIEGKKIGDLMVFNCYTQYNYGRNHASGDKKPLDYEALTLCLRKLNQEMKGKRVGLPLIGGGLAGGDSFKIIEIMKEELKDCDVTLVLKD